MHRVYVRGSRDRARLTFSGGCVAAIGVFDGVHRGHQNVIRRAVAAAKRRGVPSVVVTFDPHPVAVLHPRRFHPYISTLEHRLRLIEALGVDHVVVIGFSRTFSLMPPRDFVRTFLVEWLGVKQVVIGCDFHFGHGGQGSVAMLRELGQRYGFGVQQLSILRAANRNIKSTYIKKLISDGNLSLLRRLLSRPYSFLGVVEGGDARGRRLGYRTANFQQENVVTLPPGIYLVRASWAGHARNGLCYIGRRPTFKGADAPLVTELHLLDHDGGLYGKMILVEFLRRLRDDRRFSDERELVAQIARDVARARLFFRRHP